MRSRNMTSVVVVFGGVLALALLMHGVHFTSTVGDADTKSRLELAASRAKVSELEAKLATVQVSAQTEAAKPEVAGKDDGKGHTRCVWNKHPGTSLGSFLDHPWVKVAKEGGEVTHSGEVRYGNEITFVTKTFDGGRQSCATHVFGMDPTPGAIKGCYAQELSQVRSGADLDTIKQTCEAVGMECKGVSCVGGGTQNCSIRDGAPYLSPAVGEESYTKTCTSTQDLPGAGLAGKHRYEGEPTIFVSMAAYRDKDVPNTLVDMFKKAKFPGRVFVGVVCQVKPEDPACIPIDAFNCTLDSGFCATDQIRERKFDSSLAEGPTHARALAASMYRGEDFFFMMDAHNRFVRGWDVRLMRQMALCQETSPRCVFSCYPQAANVDDPANPYPSNAKPGTPFEDYHAVSYQCGGEFHDRSIIKNQAAATVAGGKYPRPQPYTGAGLLFGPGSMITEAPFDPNLPFLWDGEEFLYTARLWTWGYDLYSPGENILFHWYLREGAPRVWSDKKWKDNFHHKRQDKSYMRLQYILDAPKPDGSGEPMVPRDTTDIEIIRDLPKYGLGPIRSIDEFWKYARIDVSSRSGDAKIKDHKGHFCTRYGPPSDKPYVPHYMDA